MDTPPPVTATCQPSPAMREWLAGSSPMLRAQMAAAEMQLVAAGICPPKKVSS